MSDAHGHYDPPRQQLIDMVNHPRHYTRGPEIVIEDASKINKAFDKFIIRLECIQVIRHIPDMRLANAIKYIWRVVFGGKTNDQEDIQKAIWYLNDWLENPAGDR
jgi:uncharacterized protein DUF3310